MQADETNIQTLVVPLDGSVDSEGAVHVATLFAAAIGAKVQLLSTVAHPGEVGGRQRQLDAVMAEAAGFERVVVLETDPAAAIREMGAMSGRQVCMSTRGRGRSAAVLGSVALRVVTTLDRPVFCVGSRLGVPRADAGSTGVLVCLDGSPRSEAVLPLAACWAALLDKPLTLTTAVEDVPPSLSGGPPRRRFGPGDPHAYLTGQANQLRDSLSVPVQTRVLTDRLSPASALRAQMGKEATTMVVAGTRGRGGAARGPRNDPE
ncbi:MAG: universal stress protein [Actinomycetota bacterium]|jgi:nucleotide-binding universal stress UspA family protein